MSALSCASCNACMLSVVQCYTYGTGFPVLSLSDPLHSSLEQFFLVLCQVYQCIAATTAWKAEATTQSTTLAGCMLSGREKIMHSRQICTLKTMSQSRCLPVVFGCELICSVYHEITVSTDDCTIFTAEQHSWCVLSVHNAQVRISVYVCCRTTHSQSTTL